MTNIHREKVKSYQKGNLALRYGDLDEAERAFIESQKIASAFWADSSRLSAQF